MSSYMVNMEVMALFTCEENQQWKMSVTDTRGSARPPLHYPSDPAVHPVGVQKHRQVGQDDHQVLDKDAVVLHGVRG